MIVVSALLLVSGVRLAKAGLGLVGMGSMILVEKCFFGVPRCHSKFTHTSKLSLLNGSKLMTCLRIVCVLAAKAALADGWTPLCFACSKGYISIVNELLFMCADPLLPTYVNSLTLISCLLETSAVLPCVVTFLAKNTRVGDLSSYWQSACFLFYLR